MTSANFSHSLSDGLESAAEPAALPQAADELMFIQDTTGYFWSFEWQQGKRYCVNPDRVRSTRLPDCFRPLASDAYFDRLRRVLNRLAPERFSCYFQCGDPGAVQTLLFDLVMSPVLVPEGAATLVVVAGRMVPLVDHAAASRPEAAVVCPPLAPSSDRYQKLLTQIAWNIRRTLDLSTIWQQTVKGIGKALSVSRCIICPYSALSPKVVAVAEYCKESYPPLLGQEFRVADDLHLSKAIATLKPVVVQDAEFDPGACALVASDASRQSAETKLSHCQQSSTLIIATCYQDQPNGLIILHQCDRPRPWSEAELEFIQELADQVGTAIAHATLFNDSQSLATELQRANSSLLQKHRELEEARRQAEEASRLKSEFLANTSHELRTPLNGMIGFLKLIMDGMADDPKEQSEFIDEAYRSALHLLDIIADVLDIAKIEAGKLDIEFSPVKLDEILTAVENFTSSQVQHKNLSFEIQKPPTDDEIILYGNYQRLLQVMLNLVGNAIKFTHEGGITIGVKILKKKVIVQNQEFPSLIEVRVADTGIGVSLDKQDKLFQSFSQVDGSRTRQYGGTGLGLAISQKLVEAMGGEVNFFSLGEGLGSTVTFTVPLFQEPIMITSQPSESGSALRLSQPLYRE
jgi:signal transduction histidine kinase